MKKEKDKKMGFVLMLVHVASLLKIYQKILRQKNIIVDLRRLKNVLEMLMAYSALNPI